MTANRSSMKMVKAVTGAAALALFAGLATSACGSTPGPAGKSSGSLSPAPASNSGPGGAPPATTSKTQASQAPAVEAGPGWSLAITDLHDAKHDTLVLVSP